MRLEFESGRAFEVTDPYDLEMIKVHLGGDSSFVIMASADEDYIQAADDGCGFSVEKRTSTPLRHVVAYKIGVHAPLPVKRKWYDFGARARRPADELFTRDQVVALFRAYLDATTPDFAVAWRDRPDLL